MNSPRVYIVQDQKQLTGDGQLVAKFDFTPAERYGELFFLLKSGSSPFNLPPVIDELHKHLQNYRPNYDYLLLTGNPVLIGLTVAIAANYADGKVLMLQWSGSRQAYLPVTAALWSEEAPDMADHV